VGDRSILSEGLGDLAPFYMLEGNLTAAVSLVEDALAAAREIRDFLHVMISLLYLTIVTCSQGDTVKAKGYCFQALDFAQETGSTPWLAMVIFGFGVVAIFSGQPGRGVQLLAAILTWVRQRGFTLNLLEGEGGPGFMIFRQALEKAQAQLGPAAFQAAWAEGPQMPMEQALALATEDKDSQNPNGEVVKT
jgi:hypothetical protein